MYLDPGFGSMIIQVAIASFAAFSVMFVMLKGKILGIFKKEKKTKEDDNV